MVVGKRVLNNVGVYAASLKVRVHNLRLNIFEIFSNFLHEFGWNVVSHKRCSNTFLITETQLIFAAS